MFLGSLDLKTGLLRYCNAGHNPPVVIAPDGTCTWLDTVPNLPVGVVKAFAFEEQCLTLPDNSSLIFYTDGITEAENARKQLYGKDRLLDTIRKNCRLTPCAMIEALLSDMGGYVNGLAPSDDVALMVILYKLQNDTSALIIDSRIEELDKVTAFVRQAGERLNLPPALTMKLNVALEEVVANVIQYGKQETETIEIACAHGNGKLAFTITDTCEAFDPTGIADADITLPAEDRPVGKLGVFLIKQIMDEVTYRRENGKNILTLTKYY
jgi:sigma-B regulation protein RsbU (phosphoserine phosphatase)